MVQNVEAYCSPQPPTSPPPPLWACFQSLWVTCTAFTQEHRSKLRYSKTSSETQKQVEGSWTPRLRTVQSMPPPTHTQRALAPSIHFLPQEAHGLCLAYLLEFPGWHDVQMRGDQKPSRTYNQHCRSLRGPHLPCSEPSQAAGSAVSWVETETTGDLGTIKEQEHVCFFYDLQR